MRTFLRVRPAFHSVLLSGLCFAVRLHSSLWRASLIQSLLQVWCQPRAHHPVWAKHWHRANHRPCPKVRMRGRHFALAFIVWLASCLSQHKQDLVFWCFSQVRDACQKDAFSRNRLSLHSLKLGSVTILFFIKILTWPPNHGRLLLSTWALRINFHISNKCQLLIVQIVKTWPSYFYFGQKMNILCRQSRAAWCIGFSMIVSCDRLLIYSTFSVKISLSSFACVTVKNHPRYGCSRWFHVNINIAPKN